MSDNNDNLPVWVPTAIGMAIMAYMFRNSSDDEQMLGAAALLNTGVPFFFALDAGNIFLMLLALVIGTGGTVLFHMMTELRLIRLNVGIWIGLIVYFFIRIKSS